MRILYDGAIYQWQRYGGVNRYFANLISRLPSDFDPVLTTARQRGITFPDHPRLKIVAFERFRPQRLSLRLEKLYFERRTAKHKFDLVHPTYYTVLSQSSLARGRVPIVVTFWDMIHDFFPEVDPSGRVVAMKRKAAAAADAIICISENTKEDLLERYSVPPEKVIVTYLASELDFTRANGPQPVPSRPFFLYVGSRQGYKNFDQLLDAFARIATENRDPLLCIVGPPLSNEEEKRIGQLGLSARIQNLGFLHDDHLAKLYQRSVALIYPSLYEGFGLPAVEAMACGAPVIASNRASLPEVINNAGLLFDPECADELPVLMRHLLESPSARDALIKRGFARAQDFSWEKTADQTVDLYRKVAGR